MKENLMKKVIIAIFLLLIYLPLGMTLIHKVTNRVYDAQLGGFTTAVEKPDFSLGSFSSGEFQSQFATWYNRSFITHGFFTKICKSLDFYLFNQGVDIVGKNSSLMEPNYVYSTLGLTDKFDYTIPENQAAMADYVNKLSILNDKLAQHGKRLFVFTAPGKSDVDPSIIPWNYRMAANPDGIGPYECFRDLITETDVPYWDAGEMASSITECPTYYSAGIHWTRPYEQRVSIELMHRIAGLTNMNYHEFVLGDMVTSQEGFWRDTDLANTMNAWVNYDDCYYQYNETLDLVDNYDELNLIIYGDSFAQGLTHDIEECYPQAFRSVYYINYDYYMQRLGYGPIVLDGDYSLLNLQEMLDNSDVVIVESCAPNIPLYSNGFVDFLIAFLDTYEPQEATRNTVSYVDRSDIAPEAFVRDINDQAIIGAYLYCPGDENQAIWSSGASSYNICDENLKETGIEIELAPTRFIYDNMDSLELTVYVNHRIVLVTTVFDASGNYDENVDVFNYVIDGSEFDEAEDGIYEVELIFSDSLVPSEVDGTNDSNHLTTRVNYVGGAR